MTRTEQLSMAIELHTRTTAAVEASGAVDSELAENLRVVALRLELAKAQAENRALKNEAQRQAEAELKADMAADELAEAEAAGAAVKPTKAPRRKAGRVVEVRDIQSPAWTRHGVKHEGEIAQGHHATIEVGKSIRLHGVETNRMSGPLAYDRTFGIGDTVAVDSWNLTYLGVITGIGAKTVTIEDQTMGRVKRLSLYEFSWRNRCLDLERIAADNADTMMAI